jgi:hypothetical protein
VARGAKALSTASCCRRSIRECVDSTGPEGGISLQQHAHQGLLRLHRVCREAGGFHHRRSARGSEEHGVTLRPPELERVRCWRGNVGGRGFRRCWFFRRCPRSVAWQVWIRRASIRHRGVAETHPPACPPGRRACASDVAPADCPGSFFRNSRPPAVVAPCRLRWARGSQAPSAERSPWYACQQAAPCPPGPPH